MGNEGGKEGFSQAIRSRTENWVKNLKKYQSSPAKTTKGYNNVQNIAKESLSIIKNMQKAVEKNVEEIKQQVDVFTKPPPKKVGWIMPRMDTIRIGYLVGRDIRIFTNGVLLNSNKDIKQNVDDDKTCSGWSKPIHLKELTFTAAELAPPI